MTDTGGCGLRGFERPETLPPPPSVVERLLDEALVCMCAGRHQGDHLPSHLPMATPP